jgi:signal transduction histidine kinase
MVRPVGELSAVSRRLAGGDLDARARPAGPPEIRDVATGLNHLAARIRDLLGQEREAAADLSHRLRTPLMALRLDAGALRDQDEAEHVSGDIDALERAVSQSISDARRPAATRAGQGSCDAAQVVAERVEFWSVLSAETGRDVEVDLAAGPLPVRLGRGDLAACIDALLGNVFAHTPDGTGFAVRLASLPGGRGPAGHRRPRPRLPRRAGPARRQRRRVHRAGPGHRPPRRQRFGRHAHPRPGGGRGRPGHHGSRPCPSALARVLAGR